MRRLARCCLALVLAAPGIGIPDVAVAEADDKVTARLEWRRSPGAERCITEEELARSIEGRWERRVFTDAPRPDIRVIGDIARDEADRGWVVTIALEGQDGTTLGSRQLRTEAPDCSSLDDSLALAIGLMLDVSKEKLAEERAAAEAGGPSAATVRPASPPKPKTIRVPADTPARRPPWSFRPELGLGAAAGLLPGVALSLDAGVTVTAPHWFPITLRANLWLEKNEGKEGGGSLFSMYTGELELCPVTLADSLVLRACVLERVGVVQSEGYGFDRNVSNSDVLFNVGVRAQGTLPLVGPLALLLRLGGEAPLVRHRFFYSDQSGTERPLFTVAPVVGSGSVGLGLEI